MTHPERPTICFDHQSGTYAADPVTAVRMAREQCPMGWSEAHGGFWYASAYAEAADVLHQPGVFSSRHDLDPGSPYGGILIPPGPVRMWPLESDPPEWNQYRRLLNPLFAPAATKRLVALIDDVTTWCIDRRIETGAIDLVYDLASPVPAMATLHFLGLPLEDWERYATAFHDIVAHLPGTPEFDHALTVAGGIVESLREVVEQRRRDGVARRNSSGEFLGAVDYLLDARVDDEPIATERLLEMLFLIMGGGVDTTTGATAGALVHLATHDGDRQRLIADPDLLPTACEEFLRYVTPSPVVARTANHDEWVGGQQVHEHERVLVGLFAANHDPKMFAAPDQVVLDRSPNRHMTFGLGIHRCIGSNMARVEMRAMVREVLARLPDYQLVPGASRPYESAGQQNGYITVPATFTPGPRVGTRLDHLVLTEN